MDLKFYEFFALTNSKGIPLLIAGFVRRADAVEGHKVEGRKGREGHERSRQEKAAAARAAIIGFDHVRPEVAPEMD